MTLYATLDDVKKSAQITGTTDDDVAMRNLRTVSRRVDRLYRSPLPYFAPHINTKHFRIEPTRINTLDYTYRLPWPLLSLTAVTLADTALTVGTQVEAWPTVDSPFKLLRMMDGWTWYSYSTSDYEPALIKVTGIWGWHHDYSNAWLGVTTLAAAIATTTITSITVTDIDGTDAYGRAPWLSPGSLLQIDSEWLEVTAVDTGTNVATVRRGVNGSTAATHDNASTVSVYQVEEDIRDVVTRQAAFKYARRGAYESITITDLGAIQFPTDLLHELKSTIAGYAAI